MKDIKCFDYTTDKTKRKLMGKMIDKLEEKDKEIERLNNIINDLEDRIDKAIEYINKYEYQRYCPSPYEKEKYIMREEKEGQELLSILRGEDNES